MISFGFCLSSTDGRTVAIVLGAIEQGPPEQTCERAAEQELEEGDDEHAEAERETAEEFCGHFLDVGNISEKVGLYRL